MIAYKTFYEQLRGILKETTDPQGMERVRQAAQQFINQEIGAEQVLTIAEYLQENKHFYITVWYRVPSQ